MPSLIPTKISRPKPYLLKLEYDDSQAFIFLLTAFRDECPCAFCKGETIMGTHYSFGMKQFAPGMNELVSLTPTGNYGVQATWKDGHDSGIYTWEMLRTIATKHGLNQDELSELASKE